MKRSAKKLSTVSILLLCSSWLFMVAVRKVLPPLDDRERGDVPGWVMITLVTAV